MEREFTTPPLILRVAQVKARTGLSRSSIYNFIKAGRFPQSVLLGARAVGWLDHEVDAWLESRCAGADQSSASWTDRARSAPRTPSTPGSEGGVPC
jgi:prophage regulatory protein